MKQPPPTGIQLEQTSPGAIPQSEPSERVIGKKERHRRTRSGRPFRERAGSFKRGRGWETQKVGQGRGGIDQADRPWHALRAEDQTGSGDEIRHMDVFLVNIKRMAVIAFVLAKGFAMVSENQENCFGHQSPLGQALQKTAYSLVGIMQRIQI